MRYAKQIGVALWTIQGALALLFLFAGVMKFVMPIEMMTETSPLPAWFFYFIGVCEVLGALGLTLPGAARVKTGLTPLAAAGLVIIMVGATTMTFGMGGVEAAWFPFVVGVLLAIVVYGRCRLAPQQPRSYRLALRPALALRAS